MIPYGEKHVVNKKIPWLHPEPTVWQRRALCVINTIDKTDYIIADVKVVVPDSVGKGSDDHRIYRRAVTIHSAEIRQSVKFERGCFWFII